jgi:hypothetical protein
LVRNTNSLVIKAKYKKTKKHSNKEIKKSNGSTMNYSKHGAYCIINQMAKSIK